MNVGRVALSVVGKSKARLRHEGGVESVYGGGDDAGSGVMTVKIQISDHS